MLVRVCYSYCIAFAGKTRTSIDVYLHSYLMTPVDYNTQSMMEVDYFRVDF